MTRLSTWSPVLRVSLSLNTRRYCVKRPINAGLATKICQLKAKLKFYNPDMMLLSADNASDYSRLWRHGVTVQRLFLRSRAWWLARNSLPLLSPLRLHQHFKRQLIASLVSSGINRPCLTNKADLQVLNSYCALISQQINWPSSDKTTSPSSDTCPLTTGPESQSTGTLQVTLISSLIHTHGHIYS